MTMPKIRVLFIHNMVEISGGERSLINLWEHIDRARFELYVLLPFEGDLSVAARALGLKVYFWQVPDLNLWNTSKIYVAGTFLHVFLKQHSIDIIHSYSPRINFLSACVAKLNKVKVIWHERNLIFGNEPDRTCQAFGLADKIICNSNAVSRRFTHKLGFNNKVRIIHNGVNLEYFKPCLADARLREHYGLIGYKVVGLVSNLNARKRVEFLLDIAPLVLASTSQVKFLIVGGEFGTDGRGRLEELKALVKTKGIEDHVVFVGFHDDVRPFYALMDVLAHTTLKEACSRAILEAMACAKPVVAINDGGNPELFDDGLQGFLVDAQNQKAFAHALMTIITHEDRAQHMGALGRRRVEEFFDVRRNAEQTQALYLECHS